MRPQASLLALALSASLAVPSLTIAGPPEEDREAILAMAGEFEVLFNFEETVSLQPGYKLKEPYQEDATEMVVVVEDSPERIILQHILTTSGDRIVKHWKQIWTWEDTRIVEYQGHEKWKIKEYSPEEVAGTWSQQVTQVDDSPRYESFGKWEHDGGYSRWESGITARPLPRREHTKRDDYQVLQAVNRHALTPYGWVHEQDNLKQVVDEDGKVVKYIAREVGVNDYDRTEEADFTSARDYWKKTQEFWAGVSEYWEMVEAERSEFSIAKEVEEKTLMREMFAFASEIVENGESPDEKDVTASIEQFVN